MKHACQEKRCLRLRGHDGPHADSTSEWGRFAMSEGTAAAIRNSPNLEPMVRFTCAVCGWRCPDGQIFRASDGVVCPECLRKRRTAALPAITGEELVNAYALGRKEGAREGLQRAGATWPHKQFACEICKKRVGPKEVGWRMGAFFHIACQKLKKPGEHGVGVFAHADPVDWRTCDEWCCAAMRAALEE